jgi:polyphosphate kinase 2 (PPK2 family)
MPDMRDLREIETRETCSKADSVAQLGKLQRQLLRFQQSTYKHGHKIVLVFEGADASGKGGAIKRLTQTLDPRGFHVYPIGAPDAREKGLHYLQRFWERLPERGQIGVFDRSWYGRVLVERVDQLTPVRDWQRAYAEINEMERWLKDDGYIILKFFMHISQEEGKQRLLGRMRSPDKRWKINAADLDAFEQWDEYTDAWNDMLEKTNTTHAPWFVIPGDNKHAARVSVLNWLVIMLGEQLHPYAQKLDPELMQRARTLFQEDIPD